MKEILIGFDSAWTDNLKNPGAISACMIEDGKFRHFTEPRHVTFDAARQFINDATVPADYALVAIDQPTIVPNYSGCRPVDRAAASLISRLNGGVQPARRGGSGARMFGDAAPVWRFLAALAARESPLEARQARTGLFLIEVFPALALPAMVPALWLRGSAAKYNPDRKKTYKQSDWREVALGVGTFARNLAACPLADWLETQAARSNLRKADQDRLDAGICLTIALAWRFGPPNKLLHIGDETAGYMATIVSDQTRHVLVTAAEKLGVAVDRAW